MDLEENQSLSSADGLEIQTPDTETKTEKISEVTKEPNVQNELDFDSQEIQENEIDRKLHEEILEKLDIKQKEKNQDFQENSPQEKLKQEAYLNKNSEKSQLETQVEQSLTQDFAKIQKLVQAGLINSGQGQNLKKQVLKKAFDKLVQTEKIKRSIPPALTPNIQMNRSEVFEEFRKSNPDFFNPEGRQEVLNYLKSGDVILGKDELNKISDIIRTVEKSAINRYLKKMTHEKTLRESNETAKQRLTANAQKSNFSGNLSRTFTREQIGKMSSAEFAKYEPAIMEQLKKGQIR
ncbi:MAG: hypothetical protein WCY19_08165 [Candidatus Gastranaerophilaceae bacterium]